MSFTNLRGFIKALRKHGEITEIDYPVDPTLEIAEIHRRVAAANGPALFFKNVKRSSFPVVTNLFGSKRRIELAFGQRPERFVQKMISLLTSDFPPRPTTLWKERSTLLGLARLGTRRVKKAPITEVQHTPDLEQLPLLKSWPEDGGHFVTLPLVYTEPVSGGPPNLGMYRIQRYNKTQTGLHFQIQKGGGFHYYNAEKQDKSLPVAIFIGGPPALILSSICPLPENLPEIMIASLLQGSKVKMVHTPTHPLPLIGECEFALVGYAKPHIRRDEGPFGDHYGYYSLKHPFPLFDCDLLYHRKDAIYPATVVGKPRQEDFYIGDYLQKLLSPIFPMVMPAVKDLWSYGETGFHPLSAAVVKDRYTRECMTSAFRILGEGQLSLTKFLILTDKSVDLTDFKTLFTTVLERFRPERDLFIFSNLSLDTLDYTGPRLNEGSRGVLVGVGEKVRALPQTFSGTIPRPLTGAQVFSPGCLVLEAPNYKSFSDFSHLLNHADFAPFPLLILVDDLKKTIRNQTTFLWTVFTRFEPAADLFAKKSVIIRHHLSYELPILIDARMKPSYPKELLPDHETTERVDQHWNDYFPSGMEMGDSLAGHAC